MQLDVEQISEVLYRGDSPNSAPVSRAELMSSDLAREIPVFPESGTDQIGGNDAQHIIS
jgi:hypothetical protein